MDRKDRQGFSTKVTKLGDGYGCRVFKNDKLICEAKVMEKRNIRPALREILRMVDKLGFDSDMASASRDRTEKWDPLQSKIMIHFRWADSRG